MRVNFTVPTTQDYEDFKSAGLNASACLDDRIKAVIETEDGNSAPLYIDRETYERLGEKYISSNITLSYSESLEEWVAKLSQNAYYNSTVRYPEKMIQVSFVGYRHEDGAEIYRSQENSSHYYLRQVSAQEPFARWFGCKGRSRTDSGSELRSNLVFIHNVQTERIRYDDWNGVAAYSDTFNPNFS